MKKWWNGLFMICLAYAFFVLSAFVHQGAAAAAAPADPNDCGTDDRCRAIHITYHDSFGRFATPEEYDYWYKQTNWTKPSDLIAIHRETLKTNTSMREDMIRRSYTAVFWRGPFEEEGYNELAYWSERVKNTGQNYKELYENHLNFIKISESFRRDLIVNSYYNALGREPNADELQTWMVSLADTPATFTQMVNYHKTQIRIKPSLHRPIIEAAYQKVLGYQPSDDEVNTWSELMTKNEYTFGYICGMLQFNLRGSQDLRNRLIYDAYKKVYDRDPKQSEYEHWNPKIEKEDYNFERIESSLKAYVKENILRLNLDLSLYSSFLTKRLKLDTAGNIINQTDGNLLEKAGNWSVMPKASVVAAGGANVVAAGGMNVVAAGGMNVVAAGGMNVIAFNANNVVAAGGMNAIFRPYSTLSIPDTSSGVGSISGKLSDDDGVAVSGVKVKVYDQQENLKNEATTDEEGNYFVDYLTAGESYTVRAEVGGFTFTYPDPVTVISDESTDVSFYLGTLLQQMNLNGKKLARNMIFLPKSGVAKISTGTLDLNGFELTIVGDLNQTGGTVKVNKGKLTVKGNYMIETITETGRSDSSGILQMLNPEVRENGAITEKGDRVVVEQDFVMHSSQSHYNQLTGGTLDVKGDFTQLYGTHVNFYAGSKLKVILSGKAEQTVHFDMPDISWSHFNELEITNTSKDGVLFETPVSVKNLYYESNVHVRAESIMDWTLTKDAVIESTLKLQSTSSTINLADHTLTVQGDLIHSGGKLAINHGTLIVKGDYRIEAADGTSGSGILEMLYRDSNPDEVIVYGDFRMHSTVSHYDKLTGGILEVKGNFTQLYGTHVNFYAGSKLKVILSGTEKQTVYFENPYYTWSHFNELEIKNQSVDGVVFKTPVSVYNMYFEKGVKLQAVSIMNWTLTKDAEIQGDLKLEDTSSTIDLADHKLTIFGDLTHSGGKLAINHGTLLVKGDYQIENADGTSGSGILEMLYADTNPDEVTVEGNFVMNSTVSHYDKLTGGILDVKGDFTQLYGTQSNFYAGSKFKVILSGTEKQTVSFENPYYTWSHFNELEIKNQSVDGVVFKTPVSVYNMYFEKGVNLHAVSLMNWTLTKDVEIQGDLKLEDTSSTIDLKDHQLTINGDLIHSGGKLAINHGTLLVKGDYKVENTDGTSGSGILEMLNAGTNPDEAIVEGDFVMNSTVSHNDRLIGGILEVKGNLSQLYGTQSNFYTGSNFKVILSGTSKQIVHFDYPSYSRLNELEITNTSPEGVIFETPVRVQTMYYSDDVKLSVVSIMGWKLTKDVEITGDFKLEEPSTAIDLNDHKLTINGNFYHTGGKLSINHGQLVVNGNYKLETPDGTDSTGILDMANWGDNPDEVIVGGDFVMHSTVSHVDWLDGGILDIKGNFSQLYGTQSNFYTGSKLKVIFSGTQKQSVSFEHPDYSHFTEVEITNKSADGVVFTTPVSVRTLYYDHDSKLSAVSIMDWTLTKDVAIDGNFKLEQDFIDLNEYQLTINGNFYHTGGKLSINHGQLVVNGDYRIEKPDGTDSTGILSMTYYVEKPSEVIVNGNFVMHSTVSHNGWLNGGVLDVKGNFSQLYGTQTNFYAGSSFKVILSGDKKQVVHFDNPDTSYSRFYILEIKNTSKDGVVFETDYKYVKLIDHRPNVHGVLTQKGVPISGVTFSAHTADGTNQWYDVQTDENGEFHFKLADGSYQIDGIWLESQQKWYQLDQPFTVKNGVTDPLLIDLPESPKTTGIQGSVVKGNIAIPNVWVSIHTTGEMVEWFDVQTDETGAFQVVLPDGDYQIDGIWVDAEAKWYELNKQFTVLDGKIDGANEFVIELSDGPVVPDCNVTGKVTKGTVPVSATWLSVHTTGENSLWYDVQTDETGAFEFLLPDGDYQLDGIWVDAEAKWYELNQTFSVKDGKLAGITELSIDLDGPIVPEFNTTGTVTKGTTPVTGVWVSVHTVGENSLWYDALTDENGSFGFNLPSGVYQIDGIWVDSEQKWYPLNKQFTVADEAVTLNLDLTPEIPKEKMRGTLKNGTESLGLVPFSFHSVGGTETWYDIQTDAEGNFELPELPDGDYLIEGIWLNSEQKWYELKQPFTVENGALKGFTVLEINLDGTTPPPVDHKAKGQVKKGDQGVSDLPFSFHSVGETEVWYDVWTDAEGNFEIKLPDGEYVIEGIWVDSEQKWYDLKKSFTVVNGVIDGDLTIQLGEQVPPPVEKSVKGQLIKGATPITNVWVSIHTVGDIPIWYDALTDTTGNFEFKNLPDGSYVIEGIWVDSEQKWYELKLEFTVVNGEIESDLLIDLGN